MSDEPRDSAARSEPRADDASASPLVLRGEARLGAPRALRLAAVDRADDVPSHVRAASALRRWGDQLVIVQDDVSALALVDEDTGEVSSLLLPPSTAGQRSFSDARGNKDEKLDLEACAVLPDGRLLVFGSGSTAARERVVLVDSKRRVRVVDAAPLYRALRTHPALGDAELNLEGAVVCGARLRLFQRGNGLRLTGALPTSVIFDVELEALLRLLDAASATMPEIVAAHPVELGSANGVRFGFTDATLLPDGRVLFLAAAEDSPDAYRDGPVSGARVGLLDGERVVVADVLEEDGTRTARKLEGVEVAGAQGGEALELWVVSDPDDAEIPAALLPLSWSPAP
ncbi:MAG: hypothetical protein OZ928_10060 [Polyangiaceae bacterium]|nr:hypothetical protein [Polyangiaceae bacterium]